MSLEEKKLFEVNSKIIGTYWLVANHDGRRLIVRGKKPTRVGNLWITSDPEIGWIPIDESLLKYVSTKSGEIIPVSLYKELSFPKINYENDPMKIEIGKTGKIYTHG